MSQEKKTETAAEKTNKLIPEMRTTMLPAITEKLGAIVGFAFDAFLLLVSRVCEDVFKMQADFQLVKMVIEAHKAQSKLDAETIKDLNRRLSDMTSARDTATSLLNARIAELDDLKRRTSGALLTLGQVCGVGGGTQFEPVHVTRGDLTFEEAFYLFMGRKIEAIKCYRERTGRGLADSKAAVEGYSPNSKLWQDMKTLTERWGQGCYVATNPPNNGRDLMMQDLRVQPKALTSTYVSRLG